MKTQSGWQFVGLVGLLSVLVWSTEVKALDQIEAPMHWTTTPAEYVSGFGAGFSDFLRETLHCLTQLVVHPIASGQEFVHAVVYYDETYAFVMGLIKTTIEEYPSYSTHRRARLHSRLGFETAYLFLPLTLPFAILGKVGAIAKAGQQVAIVAKQAARAAQTKVLNVMPATMRGALKAPAMKVQPVGIAEWFAADQ